MLRYLIRYALLLTVSSLRANFFFFFVNNEDPDETAHHEPSHQDLHCWSFFFFTHTPIWNKASRKHTAYIILTPLKPYFYIVKLGFTGVYIIFLISAQKHGLWVLVRTASARRFLRVPTIYVLSRNMKNIRVFV